MTLIASVRVINSCVALFNVYGVDLEVYKHPDSYWHDDRILFYSDPDDKKRDIIQYLYNEGFIQDRRTPYTIRELS